jgi:chromate transport protein ChrA
VIAGNLAVMVALVVVAAAAALWQPARLGAALLAGALIPMVAQVITALIQLGQGVSPAQFGISPGRAAQAGLTITSGLTAAFWIYLVLVIALAGICAWMLVPARPRRQNEVNPATAPAAVPWQAR